MVSKVVDEVDALGDRDQLPVGEDGADEHREAEPHQDAEASDEEAAEQKQQTVYDEGRPDLQNIPDEDSCGPAD